MRKIIIPHIMRFRHSDQGVTLVEYALALTVAVIVGTGGVVLLGASVGEAMSDAVVSMPD